MLPKLDSIDQVHSDRRLRDVLALSTLPSMWLGAAPVRVAESLAAALYAALEPAFTYVCLKKSAEKRVDIAQTDRYKTDPILAGEVGDMILEWAREHDPEELLCIPHPTGTGTIRIAARQLGFYGSLGVVAAGFLEDGTPTDFHQILLGVAAAQGNTAIQNAKLVHSLRESELRFRTVIDQASTGVMQTDSTGRFTLVNQRWCEMIGYTEAELLQMNIADLAAPGTSLQMKNALSRLAGGEANIIIEERYCRKEGPQLWASSSVNALRNSDAEFLGLVAVVLDISERKAAQARAELLSKLTQDVAALSDPTEIIRITTQTIGEFLGVHRCYFFEVPSDSLTVQVLPEWRQEGVSSLEGSYDLNVFGLPEWWEGVQRGPVSVADIRAHPWTKDFQKNYHDAQIGAYILAPFIDKGRWVVSIGVSSDGPRQWLPEETTLLENVVARVWPLVERARAEENLREKSERLRFMAESMPQKIFTAKADGDVDYLNQQWSDYTGKAPEKIKGWNWLEVVHPDDVEKNLLSWKHSVETGEYFKMEHRFRRKDGIYRWHLSRAHPMRDADGKVVMWLGSNTDIDDQKRAAEILEQTIAERTSELCDKVRELEAFSYSISHDMRSPLRAMQGFAKALLDDYTAKLDEEGRDFLRRIYRAASRLDLLIQDILSYSHTSKAKLELVPVDLAALVHDTAEQYACLQESAKVTIQDPLPQVLGHQAFASQIFSNLMTNAVKFAREGTTPEILVRAEAHGEMVRIWVEDNGIGIDASHINRIFEIFGRVYSDRKYEGTGIGLAIVKRAVERMGGTIGVDSIVGVGSRFWFTLKRA